MQYSKQRANVNVPTGVDARVVGADAVDAMLAELQARAKTLSPALLDASVDIQRDTDRLWAGERKPLAASTRATKAGRGQPSTPLVATGATRVAAEVIDFSVSQRTLKIEVDPKQSRFQRSKGRPVLPDTKKLVGLVMNQVYRHLDVDRG